MHRSQMTGAAGPTPPHVFFPRAKDTGLSRGTSGLSYLRPRQLRMRRGPPPAPSSQPQPLPGPQAQGRYLNDSSSSRHLTTHDDATTPRPTAWEAASGHAHYGRGPEDGLLEAVSKNKYNKIQGQCIKSKKPLQIALRFI